MTPLEAIQIIEHDDTDSVNLTDIYPLVGDRPDHRIIKAVQCLIDTGIIWELQGSYQRLAFDMLNEGLVSIPDNYTAILERRQRLQFPEVFNI